jgi:hypothetical protein
MYFADQNRRNKIGITQGDGLIQFTSLLNLIHFANAISRRKHNSSTTTNNNSSERVRKVPKARMQRRKIESTTER